METKHTEGTWKTGPCTEGIEVFVRGTAIARCPKSFSDEEFNKEVEANAKLIAAAPELLEALVGLINGINPQDACRGKYVLRPCARFNGARVLLADVIYPFRAWDAQNINN